MPRKDEKIIGHCGARFFFGNNGYVRCYGFLAPLVRIAFRGGGNKRMVKIEELEKRISFRRCAVHVGCLSILFLAFYEINYFVLRVMHAGDELIVNCFGVQSRLFFLVPQILQPLVRPFRNADCFPFPFMADINAKTPPVYVVQLHVKRFKPMARKKGF